ASEHPDVEVRGFFAVGTMIGFLSHLVLDELCSVGFNGVAPTLNQFAGTAVKFYSPSKSATVFTYLLLGGLGYLAYGETQHAPACRRPWSCSWSRCRCAWPSPRPAACRPRPASSPAWSAASSSAGSRAVRYKSADRRLVFWCWFLKSCGNTGRPGSASLSSSP